MAGRTQQDGNGEDQVMALFLKAIETVGGSGSLVSGRRMDWLPDLMQASYIIVLQEERHHSPETIADEVGVTMETIESVLSAPTESAIERLKNEPPDEQAEREYVAGGVARLAWQDLQAHHPH